MANGLRVPLYRGLRDSWLPPSGGPKESEPLSIQELPRPVSVQGTIKFCPPLPERPSRAESLPEDGTRAAPGPPSNPRGPPREAEKKNPSPGSAAPVRLSSRGLTGPRCVLTVVAMVLRRPCASPTARRPAGRARPPPPQPASPTVVPRGNPRLSQLTVAPPRPAPAPPYPTPALPKRRRLAKADPSPSG